MTGTDDYLRERYGSDGGKNRLLWLGGAIAAFIIGGWLIWQAVSLTQPQAHADLVNVTTHSPSSISVRFNVSSDVGESVRCTIHALNEHGVEVGVAEVETVISSQPMTVEEDIVTTQEAVQATIESCQVMK
ncbi:MAG: DUF4307 domain-containing protein [Bowdeniella nasicola]|nr:DUF4307 domain-containing protein [Bowdeniella nasicola]